MDRNDRQAIEDLFKKLADVDRSSPRLDAEAETFIRERIARQPGAPYYMAQTIVVQEQALAAAEKRIEALRVAEIFRAKVVDTSTDHFVFELTGRTSKIEQFIAIMTELGLVEVSRTGIAAMSRGSKGML